MSYKAIPLGILLLLAVPAVSSAQVFFQAKGSGTEFCNGATTKFKSSLFFEFDPSQNLLVATDPNFAHIIANMQQSDLFFFDATEGFFSYNQNDTDTGMFAATFQVSGLLLTTFTGALNEVYSDGCFKSLTFKSAKPFVAP